MIFIIVICVVFIILCLMFGLCACLRIAGLEDDIMAKQFDEERSIESADVFIKDIGEEEDDEVETIIEGKTLHHYVVVNKEIRDAFLKNKNFNPDPSDVKILGVDLNKDVGKCNEENNNR